VGEIATYSASRVITSSDVSLGSLNNRAIATASSPGKTNDVTDESDNPNTALVNDATIYNFTSEPELEVTKTYSLSGGDNVPEVGETITYTITVENTGNVLLNGVTVTDVLTDISGTTSLTLNSGPTFVPANGITEGTLKAGETATYVAVYNIQQTAVDLGGIRNVATATASSPGNTNDVQDTSDDGDDTDGNTADDPTVILFNNQISVNAGSDLNICDDEVAQITGASASNYVSLYWSSNGDGSFVNVSSLNPTYYPGSNDISNGNVIITLIAVYSNNEQVEDTMIVNISQSPCGENRKINLNGPVYITEADGLILKSAENGKCYRLKIIAESLLLVEVNCE
jgi:uncharacterized repeat protein (TIGR01451 family)